MKELMIVERSVVLENYKYFIENEKDSFIEVKGNGRKSLSELAYHQYVQNNNFNEFNNIFFLISHCPSCDKKNCIDFLNILLEKNSNFIEFDNVLKFVSENSANFFKNYYSNTSNEEDKRNIILLKNMIVFLKQKMDKKDILDLLQKVFKYKNKKEAYKILVNIYINCFDEFKITKEDLDICVLFLRSKVLGVQDRIASLIYKRKLYRSELFQCNAIYNIGQTYKHVGQKIYKYLPKNKKQTIEDFIIYLNCFLYCHNEIIQDFVNVNVYLKNFDIMKNEIKRFFASLSNEELENACKTLDDAKEKLTKEVIRLTICNNN